MNLDPNDGHTMHYCTGWHEDIQHGVSYNAFDSDYISKDVRHLPINYIAICRHYDGEIQALKIWRFKEPNRSLLSRFQDMDPGRVNATKTKYMPTLRGVILHMIQYFPMKERWFLTGSMVIMASE